MEQEDKPRKAAGIVWGEERTDDEENAVWCEFVYYKTLYSFKTTYSRLAHTQRHELSVENLFSSILDELGNHRYSSTLQDLLICDAVTLKVSPAEKWYEPGGMLRELPKGERRRKNKLVSYFLAAVLQDYLNHEHDTPSHKELWEWLSKLRWRMGDWKVSGEPKTGYTYTRKSDWATDSLNSESFRTQFKRMINTISSYAEYMEWIKEQHAIEKMNDKKPRGRPRKKYP